MDSKLNQENPKAPAIEDNSDDYLKKLDARKAERLKRRKRNRRHRFYCGILGIGTSVLIVTQVSEGSLIGLKTDYGEYTQPQIDEYVRNRLVNQTSRNLNRIPVFAHRGFVEENLENSFQSFDLALASGCPQIELDVWESSDGVLFVSHDATLSRISNVDWKIGDHTAEELDQVVLNNGEKFHRLSEVLSRYRDQMIYLVEFKNDTKDASSFIKVVDEYPKYAENIQAQSFHLNTIEAIHQALPNMFVQWLIQDEKKLDEALSLDWLDSLSVEQTLATQSLIDRTHEVGKEIWVWTVDDQKKVRNFLDMGVDGVITDLDDAVVIYRELSANAQ